MNIFKHIKTWFFLELAELAALTLWGLGVTIYALSRNTLLDMSIILLPIATMMFADYLIFKWRKSNKPILKAIIYPLGTGVLSLIFTPFLLTNFTLVIASIISLIIAYAYLYALEEYI